MKLLHGLTSFSARAAAFLAAAVAMDPALAAAPQDWQLGLQPPATPIAERMQDFHNLLLWIISLITLFVLVLLVVVMWRFSERRNPTPTRTSHNTLLEVAWTTVPVVILVVIAIPSLQLLYFQDETRDADLTIKAIGKQWYWTYEYPDNGNFTFDAYPVLDEDLQPGQKRLLSTDNPLVIPSETKIRFLVTAGDVLHAFAVPAFGIKTDAVPGRLNETWAFVPAKFDGQTFYGQCSELCGTGHAHMPIEIKVVSRDDYAAWVEDARARFARIDQPLDAAPRPVEQAGEGGVLTPARVAPARVAPARVAEAAERTN